MADCDLPWGGDLSFDAGGDLALVDGPDEVRQRIIRRLFTRRASYIWAPEYGASIPERIGRPARPDGSSTADRQRTIAAIVRAQIELEATVAALPIPVTTVTAVDSNPGLFVIDIRYTDAVTGAAIAISLEVPGSR